MRSCDVVVVGGGIGGAALAAGLASDGLDVVVLEASDQYVDRVRGESLLPWGVMEGRRLGVEQALRDAGAHEAPAWVHYAKGLPTEVSESKPIPVGLFVGGVGGSLNLRHPDACGALAAAATAAGAEVHRGVTDVQLDAGAVPVVRCATSDGPLELGARLVVGADGRNSTVRRQAQIPLQRQAEVHMIAGLLVDGLDGVPDDHDVVATDDDVFCAVFHQGGGRARVYLCPPVSQRHRFSGPDGLDEFRRSTRLECLPFGEQLAEARAAGPLATYTADDTWAEEPFTEGVVLVGDAAGYNDPIIGQGLSIALRDARMVRDVLRARDWSAAAFAGYGAERAERMRRLRAVAATMAAAFAEDCDDRPARRERFFELQQTEPLMLAMMAGLFGGPEIGPPDAFDGRLAAAIRGT